MKKVVLLFLIIFLLATSCKVKSVTELTDADLFAKEYGVTSENPFVYLSLEEFLKTDGHETGIYYFGTNDHGRVLDLVQELLKQAKKRDVEKIYYIDSSSFTKEDNKNLEEALGQEFLSPSVYFLQEGKVLAYDDMVAVLEQEEIDYVTEEQKKKWQEMYEKAFSIYLSCPMERE